MKFNLFKKLIYNGLFLFRHILVKLCFIFEGVMSKVLLIVDMQKGFINKKVYSDLLIKINDLIKRNSYDYYILLNSLTKIIVYMSAS